MLRYIQFAVRAGFRGQIATTVERPIHPGIALINDDRGAHLHDVVVDLALKAEAKIEGLSRSTSPEPFISTPGVAEAELFNIAMPSSKSIARERSVIGVLVGKPVNRWNLITAATALHTSP